MKEFSLPLLPIYHLVFHLSSGLSYQMSEHIFCFEIARYFYESFQISNSLRLEICKTIQYHVTHVTVHCVQFLIITFGLKLLLVFQARLQYTLQHDIFV